VTLLLTRPFTDEIVVRDDADRWALMQERALRELRWRAALTGPAFLVTPVNELAQASLVEVVPARDAGDVCHVCKSVVTWTDHLPPLETGGPVRCFVNVKGIFSAPSAGGLLPGERRVGDAIVYSAEFLSGPETV
jgi:hypothetical protein